MVALTAALVAGLVWLKSHGAQAERTAEQSYCSVGQGAVQECESFDYLGFFSIFASVTAWLPFAVAAFAGGALIGRELENGTAALAWTQSVSPARWLTAELAVPLAVLLVCTSVSTALLRWVWSAHDESLVNPWFMSDVFHATGVTVLGYTVLAVAVGALAGLLTRRTLPATGLAFGALLTVYLTLEQYRTDLWPTVHRRGFQAAQVPDNADQIKLGMVMDDGRRVEELECFDSEKPVWLERCLEKEGARDLFAEVHPASHFWPIQLVETGILLALAAVVVWVAFRVLRRRTAS
jgi:hypothetical protein